MTGYVEVRFEASCPEFIGTDLESYGPFEEGDTAEIPVDNAEILVNRGQAENPDNSENPEDDDGEPAGDRLWP